MTNNSAAHLNDETFSDLLDGLLAPPEAHAARTHISHCTTCSRQLEELRAVTQLLRALPEIEPPRDFTIGPRPVGEPATSYRRLQRWYTWSRTAASAMAALFVLLFGANVYVDTMRPGAPEMRALLAREPEAAPAQRAPVPAALTPAPEAAKSAASPVTQLAAPTPPAAAAPAVPMVAPPAGADKSDSAVPEAPARSEAARAPTPAPVLPQRLESVESTPAAPAGEAAGDQRKSSTGARDLELQTSRAEQTQQPANALRLATVAAGGLAAASMLAALLLRRRLRHAQANVDEPRA
jgi:hypothetical protein